MALGTSALVWPEGYHLAADGTAILLLDGENKVLATVGDRVQAGGGFLGPENGTHGCSGTLKFHVNSISVSTP